MATADSGIKHREFLGQKKVWYGEYTAASGDTTVTITAPKNNEIIFFSCEGMTKYTATGDSYAVTITNPAATVTRHYKFEGW